MNKLERKRVRGHSKTCWVQNRDLDLQGNGGMLLVYALDRTETQKGLGRSALQALPSRSGCTTSNRAPAFEVQLSNGPALVKISTDTGQAQGAHR